MRNIASKNLLSYFVITGEYFSQNVLFCLVFRDLRSRAIVFDLLHRCDATEIHETVDFSYEICRFWVKPIRDEEITAAKFLNTLSS